MVFVNVDIGKLHHEKGREILLVLKRPAARGNTIHERLLEVSPDCKYVRVTRHGSEIPASEILSSRVNIPIVEALRRIKRSYSRH